MPSGLPGGGIARGSIFAIFGSHLGPASPVQANSFPLGTTLGGVSIAVSQGNGAVSAIPLYVSASQINAVMPSNAPLGAVTLRVSLNGAGSNPVPIRIVNSAVGIFSANSAGNGPGILQNFIAQDNQPINAPNVTAAPKQIVTLWGTGLGPVAGPDNVAPPAGNLPTQVEVDVGGKNARILYSGRTPCCSGVDQIVFEVPADAPPGCWTPVFVRTGGTVVSNVVTMAIQTGGGICSDPANPLSAGFVNGGKLGAFIAVRASTRQDIGVRAPIDVVSEYGGAILADVRKTPFPFHPVISLPPPGTCTEYEATGDLFAGDPLAGMVTLGRSLSAGAVHLTGPAGTRVISPLFTALPVGYFGGALAALGISDTTILSPGAYSVSAAGAGDLGAFQGSFSMEPNVAWTNRDRIGTIDRALGFAVSWSGASPAQRVIVAGGGVDLPTNSSALFACLAPPGSTAFAVPASALANLPPTRLHPVQSKSVVYLIALPLANPSPLGAKGLDLGLGMYAYVNGKTVSFR